MAEIPIATGKAPNGPEALLAHYFMDYLSRRWREGCVRGRELLQEIKLRGYTGSFSHLERLLAMQYAPKSPKADPS